MTAVCNGMDLSPYIAQGYVYELEEQYGDSVITMDGTDHTTKIRDRVKLTVPFIPLRKETLSQILQLFPATGAYVSWTFEDLYTGQVRTVQAKYSARSNRLKRAERNGAEYWEGLVINLIER